MTPDWDAIRRKLAAAARTGDPSPEAQAATLRERARRLAMEAPASGSEQQLEILTFQLAWESYAVETAFVREVYPLTELTPIPCTPSFVFGIINLRGELCPVIDLKRLFGLPEQGLTNATGAVILRNASMEVGIVADMILGVRSIGIAEIGPTPATLSGVNAAFLRGVGRDRTVILDGAGILAHPGIIVNEQVGS